MIGDLAKACLVLLAWKHALRERRSCSYFPRYCLRVPSTGYSRSVRMAPRASILVLVLLAAFLSPSQSLALKSSLPSGACQINSGLNAGKTGRYDTKQDPGHVYCCTNRGEDCTECLDNACSSVGARGGANRPPSAGTNSGPSGGGNTGVGVGPRRDGDATRPTGY